MVMPVTMLDVETPPSTTLAGTLPRGGGAILVLAVTGAIMSGETLPIAAMTGSTWYRLQLELARATMSSTPSFQWCRSRIRPRRKRASPPASTTLNRCAGLF